MILRRTSQLATAALTVVFTLVAISCSEDDLPTNESGFAAAVEVVDSTDDATDDHHDDATDDHHDDATDDHHDDATDDHHDDADDATDDHHDDATDDHHDDATDDHHDDATDDHHDDAASGPELPEGVDMVVEVSMVDFGYEPAELDIPLGSTVQFVFVNDGAAPHEGLFGDLHIQEEQVATAPADHQAHHHGDQPHIYLDPGESATITVAFNQPGEMIIGCHIPGHWEAGMRADITVT
jgi:uncharacterized cupredoxin-like copper-binding protein